MEAQWRSAIPVSFSYAVARSKNRCEYVSDTLTQGKLATRPEIVVKNSTTIRVQNWGIDCGFDSVAGGITGAEEGCIFLKYWKDIFNINAQKPGRLIDGTVVVVGKKLVSSGSE